MKNDLETQVRRMQTERIPPVSLLACQQQVDFAENGELIRLLGIVVTWVEDTPEMIRAREAEKFRELLQDGDVATERVRRWLHKLSQEAARRGGWK